MIYRQVLDALFTWVYGSTENPLGFLEIEPAILPLMEQWPRRKNRAEGLTGGGVAPVRGRVRSRSLWWSCRGADRRRWWSEEVGPRAQAGELVGGDRRGVRPNQGTIGQLNGSGSITRDQGRCVCKEPENGSPDCSVYARPRETEVRRRWSWVSGEVLSGSSTWKSSRVTSEANREAGATWTRLERAGRGGRGLGSGWGGGAACSRRSPVNFILGKAWERAGRYGRCLGLLYRHSEGEGAQQTWPDTVASARAGWANAGVPTKVEHVCVFILPEFWRVWSFIRACSCLGQCTNLFSSL
jgi:hypothetical protein